MKCVTKECIDVVDCQRRMKNVLQNSVLMLAFADEACKMFYCTLCWCSSIKELKLFSERCDIVGCCRRIKDVLQMNVIGCLRRI